MHQDPKPLQGEEFVTFLPSPGPPCHRGPRRCGADADPTCQLEPWTYEEEPPGYLSIFAPGRPSIRASTRNQVVFKVPTSLGPKRAISRAIIVTGGPAAYNRPPLRAPPLGPPCNTGQSLTLLVSRNPCAETNLGQTLDGPSRIPDPTSSPPGWLHRGAVADPTCQLEPANML